VPADCQELKHQAFTVGVAAYAFWQRTLAHQHMPVALTTGHKILALLGDFVMLYLGEVFGRLGALACQIGPSQTETALDDINKSLFLIQARAVIHVWLDRVATKFNGRAAEDAEQTISDLRKQLVDRGRQIEEDGAITAGLTD